MPRSEAPRERIGEMLVSLGLITRAQLDEALKAQKKTKLPIGKQLVALGAVSETRLTQVLSNQLSVPWVSLERVEFPAELLSRIPGELADRHSVMPIYVRNIRGAGPTLYVAMDDPTNEHALIEIAGIANMPVRAMIAPPTEIRRTIEHRYFGATPGPNPKTPSMPEQGTGLRSLPGRAKAPPPPIDAIEKAKQQRARKPPPPPGPTPVKQQDGAVPMEQYDTPSQPPPATASRMLTLLDGTQIALPSARRASEVAEVQAVRHVVKAIRAARTEDGSAETLRWHDIVQALIDATAARGVRLTRDEITEAWRRYKTKRDEAKPEDG